MRDTVSWGPGDGDQMAGTDSRIMVRGKPGDQVQTRGPPHPLGASGGAEKEEAGGLNTQHLDQTQIPALDPEKSWG